MTDDQRQPAPQPPNGDEPPAQPAPAQPVLDQAALDQAALDRAATVHPPAPAVATPALEAAGLGLRSGTGWIFRDVDLTVPAASLTAIVGPAGAGRSSLLLALAGRMRPAAGSLSVLGHSLANDPAAVRELTSVARIADTVRPEPALTVGESVDERCLIDDVAPAEGRIRFEQACAVLQFSPDPAAPVRTVVGEQAALLAVALAYVRTSAVIVLDDVDHDVRAATRPGLLQALRRLAATGPAIVVTAIDRSAVVAADQIVDLPAPAGQAAWTFDPTATPDAPKEAAR